MEQEKSNIEGLFTKSEARCKDLEERFTTLEADSSSRRMAFEEKIAALTKENYELGFNYETSVLVKNAEKENLLKRIQ